MPANNPLNPRQAFAAWRNRPRSRVVSIECQQCHQFVKPRRWVPAYGMCQSCLSVALSAATAASRRWIERRRVFLANAAERARVAELAGAEPAEVAGASEVQEQRRLRLVERQQTGLRRQSPGESFSRTSHDAEMIVDGRGYGEVRAA